METKGHVTTPPAQCTFSNPSTPLLRDTHHARYTSLQPLDDYILTTLDLDGMHYVYIQYAPTTYRTCTTPHPPFHDTHIPKTHAIDPTPASGAPLETGGAFSLLHSSSPLGHANPPNTHDTSPITASTVPKIRVTEGSNGNPHLALP